MNSSIDVSSCSHREGVCYLPKGIADKLNGFFNHMTNFFSVHKVFYHC